MSNFVVKNGSFHGIGTANPTATLDVGGDARVLGNLVVTGTTTTTNTENVLLQDNHLYLNAGYTSDAPQTGGLVINYDPTTTTDTVNGAYVAGVAATSNPTVGTTGAATFALADLIQISGSTNNDGLYEVLSHATNVLTIRGIGTTGTVEDFTQNQFVAGGSDGATITKVGVSVLRASTSGVWESGFGNVTPISFSSFGGGSGNVTKVGTPADNQVGVWTGDGTIEGDPDFTFDGNLLVLSGTFGQLQVGGTTSQAGKINIHRGDGVSAGSLGWLAAADDTVLQLSNGSGSGEIRINASSTSSFVTLYATGSERARLTAAGLALGAPPSTTSTNRLEIEGTYGSQVLLGNSDGSGAGRINFRRGTDGATAANLGWTTASDDIIFRLQNSSGGGELRLESSASASSFVSILTSIGEAARFVNTEVVFNEPGANYDFRVEGDTDANLLFVDASTDRVGIGTATPLNKLHILSTVPNQIRVENTSVASDTQSGAVFTMGANGGQIAFLSTVHAATAAANRLILDTNTGAGIAVVGQSASHTFDVVLGGNLIANRVARFGAAGSEIVFNDQLANIDFRVAGDTDANALIVDASTDFVGIGVAAPGAKLEVNGAIRGQMEVEAAAADPAPTAAESRKVFTNEGATGAVTMTLPSAAAGLQYTFVVQDADGITVTAAAGDTIRQAGSVSATGGTAASTTIGDTLTLVAINATEWVAVASHGTWTIT